MSYIIAKVAEEIGTITLDDERCRNALSKPLVEQAIAALHSFREAKVRVAIIRAREGAKVFSAGHDVSELPESRRDPLGWDDPLRQLVREIENFPAPVIAMVEGSVWGERRRRYLSATSSLPPRPPPSRSRLRSSEYHTMSAECSRCSMPPV